MIARAARLAAAAGALALALSAERTWRAERIYEQGVESVDPATGLPAIDAPSRDVPGRLEIYRIAAETDPRQGVFALRRGQIALVRSARRPPPPDAGALRAEARTSLRAAAERLPFDARAYDALAQVAMADGDPDAAVRASRVAVRLAPRRKWGLEAAVRRSLAAWRANSDPEALAVALEALRLGFELEDGRDPEFPGTSPPAGRVRFEAELRAPDGPTLDDLLAAVGGRPALAAAAARVAEAARPADVPALRRAAGEVRR